LGDDYLFDLKGEDFHKFLIKGEQVKTTIIFYMSNTIIQVKPENKNTLLSL